MNTPKTVPHTPTQKRFTVVFSESEANAVGYALKTTARRLRGLSRLDQLFKIPADASKEELAERLDCAYRALDTSKEIDLVNSHDRLVKALETIGRCARNAMRDLASKPQPDHE